MAKSSLDQPIRYTASSPQLGSVRWHHSFPGVPHNCCRLTLGALRGLQHRPPCGCFTDGDCSRPTRVESPTHASCDFAETKQKVSDCEIPAPLTRAGETMSMGNCTHICTRKCICLRTHTCMYTHVHTLYTHTSCLHTCTPTQHNERISPTSPGLHLS